MKDEKEIIFTQAPLESLVERVATAVMQMLERKLPVFEEKLLSSDEARKIFQPPVSRQSIANWTRDGFIKLHRVGGRNYYKKSEIIAAAIEMKQYKKPDE